MIEPHDLPLFGCVARIASSLRFDMPSRLALRADRIVTIGAHLRRAFEDGSGVARGTLDRGMRPGQRKARAEVVEFLRGLLTRIEGRRCKEQRRQE
ncbi:hypothetical protein [Novosphingobium sp.]|uniref:hypothetical protein n=1 Tax=Novosphingobium sp. TaxID=1874826 RepID=UPI00286E2F5D|nr:hypothetical protein [Novosphingobium sp.]